MIQSLAALPGSMNMLDRVFRVRRNHVLTLTAWLALIWTALMPLTGVGLAKQPQTAAGLKLPQTIAGFKKGGVHDFESEHPGLGIGVEYVRSGWIANIFIYDFGIKNIPSGAESGPVTDQIHRALNDVKQVGYKNVQIKQDYFVLSSSGAPIARCIFIDLVRKDVGRSDSFLCLTAHASKFIKVRLSTAKSGASKRIADQFVHHLASALTASR